MRKTPPRPRRHNRCCDCQQSLYRHMPPDSLDSEDAINPPAISDAQNINDSGESSKQEPATFEGYTIQRHRRCLPDTYSEKEPIDPIRKVRDFLARVREIRQGGILGFRIIVAAPRQNNSCSRPKHRSEASADRRHHRDERVKRVSEKIAAIHGKALSTATSKSARHWARGLPNGNNSMSRADDLSPGNHPGHTAILHALPVSSPQSVRISSVFSFHSRTEAFPPAVPASPAGNIPGASAQKDERRCAIQALPPSSAQGTSSCWR